MLGLLSGWFRLNHPLLRLVGSASYRHFFFARGKPLSFQLFTGESINRRCDLIYFLEIRLRTSGDFITGELVNYAVVRDEEPHRLVVLRDVQRMGSSEEQYALMEGDRLVLDLADAEWFQVSYQEKALAEAQEASKSPVD
jgi:hypothetical protein